MESFTVERNNFLHQSCTGYFHNYYVGYQKEGNPDFLNDLKNTYNSTPFDVLHKARAAVRTRIEEDIPMIMLRESLKEAVVVVVPRSKAHLPNTKMGFKTAVSEGVENLKASNVSSWRIINGVDAILRRIDTRTTHLRRDIKNYDNSGADPYAGITRDTCHIDTDLVRGKTVIVVDDIYTKTINIDEDCIQALYDAGADRVILYTVAYTHRHAYKKGA